MAKIDLGVIQTKISNIFKKDLYIYKYQYCIGGESSEVDNEGKFLCILDPNCINVIKTNFPDKELIYFSDIKKSKKEPNDYISFPKDEFTLFKVKKEVEELMEKYESNNKWEKLELSPEDINDIFFDRNVHTFFEDNDDIATLGIAKTSFPLISEKNADNTEITFKYFGTDEDTSVSSILFSYVTDWFQVIEFLMYINL